MMHLLPRRLVALALASAIGLLVAAGNAEAAPITVDFSTIGGANGDPFASVTQDGVTVASLSGNWQKAFNVGNPVPGIFTFSQIASIEVFTGGLFEFLSFDLGTGGNSNPDYSFEGFLNNVSMFGSSGSPAGSAFTTILSGSGILIDRLLVTTTLTSTSANIDNIVVDTATVPEPATLGLLSVGLLAFLARRRRTA